MIHFRIFLKKLLFPILGALVALKMPWNVTSVLAIYLKWPKIGYRLRKRFVMQQIYIPEVGPDMRPQQIM